MMNIDHQRTQSHFHRLLGSIKRREVNRVRNNLGQRLCVAEDVGNNAVHQVT